MADPRVGLVCEQRSANGDPFPRRSVLLRGDRLAHQCRPGLAKPENGASRYEYRLTILLLQLHELGESAASPGRGKQAACSFEQSVAIYDDFLIRLHAVNIVTPARVDLWLSSWWGDRRWYRPMSETRDRTWRGSE
jgi:hypothetical protein